jgi:predicted Zn finger-like uncharacterized protein
VTVSLLQVDCEACKSRFRLDSSLFKGARAIRVRCRKCGGYIIVRNPESPPVSEGIFVPATAASAIANYTFESMTELWETRYREARNDKSEFADLRKQEAFINKYEVSDGAFSSLTEMGEAYLRLIKGITSGNTYKEEIVSKNLCFFPMLLRVETVNHLPPAWAKITNTVIDETFFLGLASHLIISDHPHRHKICRMEKEGLYLDFLEACGSADRDMKEYNKDMSGVPGVIFKEQFARQVEPLFSGEFSVGFWKMGKVRSCFRNIFFSGVALGLLSDGHAEEYLMHAQELQG